MKSKVIWVVVSCLMALSLLMASCAPAVTEEEEVVAPPVEEEVVTEEEVAPPPKGPTYGGVINTVAVMVMPGLDPANMPPHASDIILLTNEELFTGDWAKGPAGTGETNWHLLGHFDLALETGCLAESWEMPDEETLVFHIRQRIHFHDKPPVNGRELVADDVIFSLTRNFDIPLSMMAGELAGSITSVEAPDKYTVVIKCTPEKIRPVLKVVSTVLRIMPADGGGEYPGDFQDWRDSCGTGPFMLVDYVDASSATFKRNPNYWRKDPVHPENTLPYLDGVKILLIPDLSTRLSALRTGKIAVHQDLTWEQRDTLFETNPELQWSKLANMKFNIVGMRVDNPELPYDDIRVRRALAMAIDNPTIVDEYYGGNAEILSWPIMPLPEFKDMYTPLAELPESTRELYEYHPDKARELLAEAGYPDGFKSEIVCWQADVDELSILKAYWADIGVDLEIKVYERSVTRTLFRERKHKHMACGIGAAATPSELAETRTGGMGPKNFSVVSDPYLDEKYLELVDAMLDWDETCRIVKELGPYILDKCWYIQPPAKHLYTFWQPWVKGYHGEWSVGHQGVGAWPVYVWVDQELKKEMTGR